MPKFRLPVSSDVSPTMVRDSLLWGTGAVFSVVLASLSFFVANDGQPVGVVIAETRDAAKGIDPITTGSVTPSRWIDKAANTPANPDFGTTIAIRSTSPEEAAKINNRQIGKTQFGIDLGASSSFSALGKRFNSMVNIAPTLFEDVESRGLIVDIENGIEAHLIVGPFPDWESAKRQCNKIRQRINTKCVPARFAGRPLIRN